MKRTIVLFAFLAGIFGMQAQNNIANSDFELWSYGQPVNWTMSMHGNITGALTIPVEVNFGEQTSDAHSGNSAIRLTSADVTSTLLSFSMNLPGILQAGESEGFNIPMEDAMALMQAIQDTSSTGIFGDLDSIDVTALGSFFKLLSNGVPCNSTPASVTAWTKYMPQGNDQMALFAMTKLNGQPVDYNYKLFGTTDGIYQQIGINFNNPGAECDSILIVFVSSSQLNSTSVLFVDDVAVNFVEGITNHDNFSGSIYPNPASDMLFIRPDSESTYSWTLTDLTGKILQTGEGDGETSVNTRSYAPGVYLLQITSDGKTGVSKVVIR